jgi:hypothetical protein
MTELGRQSTAAPTVAQKAALRWLLENEQMGFGRDALYAYYRRNGPTSGLATVSRRGAAGQMFWRLVDAGYLERASTWSDDGTYVVSAAGRDAALLLPREHR